MQDFMPHVTLHRWEGLKRGWHKLSKDPLSLTGLSIVLLVLILAVFAPYIAPYPEHAEAFVDFANASRPMSTSHLFGTDVVGRDILSRIIFGFRYSLLMGVVVLSIATPVGVILGLLAGYMSGTWIDTVIMRITDVFLSVPPLILALAICSVFTPSVFNAMIAVTAMWWPWYCRLTYGQAVVLRNEYYVWAAEVIGTSKSHTLFKEVLPNCISSILVKMSLDMGFVILLGSGLSFVGLGAQPPTPDLGTMIAQGAKYLPELWWNVLFPGLAIMVTVLGFNLLGDGLSGLLSIDRK